MTLRFPSYQNGFIPEATGQVVAFARKPERFKINTYVQYIPCSKPIGVYVELGRDEPVRIVSDEEYAWEDGDDAPAGHQYKIPFQVKEFRTFRRAYPWTLGYQLIDNTDLWKPKEAHMRAAVTKALTNRTKRIVTLAEDSSNWSDHYSDVNVLNQNRGPWDTGSDDPQSASYQAIFASLIEAAQRICLDTNGEVTVEDMQVVISPRAAQKLALAPEIVNYVRQSPYARDVIEKGLDPQWSTWGMPSQYKGFKFVVEDAVIVESRPVAAGTEASIASGARRFIKHDSTAFITSRPGGLDGEYGSPNFSTIQCYHNNELLRVQAFDDPENERVRGRVSEKFKEVLAAPVSGWLIQNILS